MHPGLLAVCMGSPFSGPLTGAEKSAPLHYLLSAFFTSTILTPNSATSSGGS